MIFVRTHAPRRFAARCNAVTALGMVAAALLAASVAGCTPTDAVHGDAWPTLEVSSDVTVIRWDPVVGLDERVAIDAERDQTIATEDGWLTGRDGILHATVLGDRLVVLSGIRGELATFRQDGTFEGVWAQKGAGSGELFGPIGVAVSNGQVHVVDVAAQRFSRWNEEGELVNEVSDDEFSQISSFAGATPQGLVVNKVLLTLEDEQQAVSLYSFAGKEVVRYAILPTDINRQDETVWPRPLVAVGSEGTVYASTASEYLIHAYGPDGDVRWVLQVEWERLPVTEATRRTVERTRRAGRALGANVRDRDPTLPIPSALPALAAIEVDGQGRLYVFPLVEGEGPYPVDVYSSSGERLLAGWLPFQSWETQSGAHVYRIETDRQTGDPVFVRYRLDLNLE